MSKKLIYPGRFLNDQRGILGLWMSDYACAFLIFCAWAKIFEDTPLALVGVVIAIGSLVAIAPLRLTTRRKIIRDFISYRLMGKRIYVPKIHS